MRNRCLTLALKRNGFTLIELLVVIAIIGILAAMLFPVFARARESARKTQCLANVKNIATAINMYLADYDRFFPLETNREAIDYFSNAPGGGDPVLWPDICSRTRQANPYLREPVILDDYVKSKEVWKCPSARIMNGAAMIVPVGRDGYWLNAWRDHEGTWGMEQMNGPCATAWPPGWGGAITDSFTQGKAIETMGAGTGAGVGVFVAGVGVSDKLHWDTPSTVNDASRYIACGDTGGQYNIWNAMGLAYPDLCMGSLPCGIADGCPGMCVADWENCAWSRNCGFDLTHKQQFIADPGYRKQFARHIGGSNVGFLDGHAKWYLADTLIFQNKPFEAYFEGNLCTCWPES